jgi:hypothetical protein
MSYIKPPHHTIPGNGPPNFSKVWDIDVTCYIIPGAADVPVQVFFVKIYRSGAHVEHQMSDFIAAIPGDAEITLKLANFGRTCRWSEQFLAVTAKDDYSSHIGGIRKIGNAIVFKVKARSGPEFHHYLNLNVELNVGTAGGTPVWKPITIDPDVINPRPPGRIAGDTMMPLIDPATALVDEIRAVGVENMEIIVAPPPANSAPMIQVPDI